MKDKFKILNKKQLTYAVSMVRISKEEYSIIKKLSSENNVTITGVVRQMITFSIKSMDKGNE